VLSNNADSLTQYGETVVTAGPVSQHGARTRHDDEYDDQTNEDSHVDPLIRAFSLLHAPIEVMSTVLTYGVVQVNCIVLLQL
jgi:hypothetical protein